jgi:hypothetical protein
MTVCYNCLSLWLYVPENNLQNKEYLQASNQWKLLYTYRKNSTSFAVYLLQPHYKHITASYFVAWDSSVGIATCYGRTLRGSNPGRSEIFCTHPDWPWGPTSLLYSGYQVFPRGKAARVWCWPPTRFYCWGWRKSKVIHSLTIWVFVACSSVNFRHIFSLQYHILHYLT